MSDDTKNPRIIEFFRAIVSDWWSGMSGALSIPFTFLGLMNMWSQKGLFFILAIVALGITTWRLWSKEKIKNEDLIKKILDLEKPKKEKSSRFISFREFIDQRYGRAETFLKFEILDYDKIYKWYVKTVEGINLALGNNVTNKDIWASLAVMQSRVENLKGHNVTRGQYMHALIQCRDQLNLIKENVGPTQMSNFDPVDLKIFEV